MISLIRTDGSFKIGIGHITRCMALAEGLSESGIKSLFIIRDYDRNVIRFIRNKGYGLKVISKKRSVKQEIGFLNRCIKKYKPLFLITDSYPIDNEYLEKIDTGGSVLVSIDGLVKKDFCSDIIINQNAGVAKKDYKGMVRKGARLLLGPRYFLLRKEFRSIERDNKKIKEKIKRILVCMGGADPVNATLKVIKALEGRIGNDIELIAIVGAAYKHSEAIKNIINKKSGKIKFYCDPVHFADIVFSSDIVICAGGVTCMEVLYMGIPAIVTIIACNQIKGVNSFAEKGVIINLGKYSKLSENNIYKAACNLLHNKEMRKSMSFKAKKLIDGKGVSRIIKEMELVYEKNKNSR